MERADFTPFVPPRRQPPQSQPADQCVEFAPEQCETLSARESEAAPQTAAADSAERIEAQNAPFGNKLLEHDLSLAIRCQATRYAAIAVGRLLRHAIAFDPAVIARFVDEAIAAASDTRVRVTTSGAGMEAGDVVVEVPSGSIAATLQERAALIVEAIAAREQSRSL